MKARGRSPPGDGFLEDGKQGADEEAVEPLVEGPGGAELGELAQGDAGAGLADPGFGGDLPEGKGPGSEVEEGVGAPDPVPEPEGMGGVAARLDEAGSFLEPGGEGGRSGGRSGGNHCSEIIERSKRKARKYFSETSQGLPPKWGGTFSRRSSRVFLEEPWSV